MNLFQAAAGRLRPVTRHAGRITPVTGRLYNIRYSMTPRGPRREQVEVHARPLVARWTRDLRTGALSCHWDVAEVPRASHAAPSAPSNLIELARRGMHGDMRPPSR